MEAFERKRRSLVVGAWIALVALAPAQDLTSAEELPSASELPDGVRPSNILLVIVDDMGNDKVGAYGEHPDAPPTPNIDALAARGVLFRNAYANPVCSPTRATIMTGRYSFRTGVGDIIQVKNAEAALPYHEITLPELLDLGAPDEWEHALVGKWHLGSASFGGGFNALQQGFDHHWGINGNLGDYFNWVNLHDGVPVPQQEYITTVQVDDALTFARQLEEPWFITLSTTAAHTPYHVPPAHLHTQSLTGEPEDSKVAHFDAAVEALDSELGRLFASLDPSLLARTNIVLVGDNGPPGAAVTPPFAPFQAKGYLYESGVNVPLIIAGPAVRARGAECGALVGTIDLFTTVAEFAGLDAQAVVGDARTIDGVSLVPYLTRPGRTPLRPYAYVEKFWPNGVLPPTTAGRAVRDSRWKLVQRQGTVDQFYDLGAKLVEGVDLLGTGVPLTGQEQDAYDALKQRLADISADD